jgi:hypothetical protein
MPTGKPLGNTTKFLIVFKVEMLDVLKSLAKAEGRSMAEIVRDAIMHYIIRSGHPQGDLDMSLGAEIELEKS